MFALWTISALCFFGLSYGLSPLCMSIIVLHSVPWYKCESTFHSMSPPSILSQPSWSSTSAFSSLCPLPEVSFCIAYNVCLGLITCQDVFPIVTHLHGASMTLLMKVESAFSISSMPPGMSICHPVSHLLRVLSRYALFLPSTCFLCVHVVSSHRPVCFRSISME